MGHSPPRLKKQDAEMAAYTVFVGLSQLRRAIDEGDPLGEVRTRVNDLVGQCGELYQKLKSL